MDFSPILRWQTLSCSKKSMVTLSYWLLQIPGHNKEIAVSTTLSSTEVKNKVNELVETIWEVETATEKIARSKLSRIDVLREQLTSACICEGEWLQCALEILSKNSIDRAVFCDAIIKLLVMGRGKGRNIYINGPANCGKTFILDPLRHIFDTFLSPATCSYAWLGVEDKELIFLNDFRWSPTIIPWTDFLLLLEGHIVHFAAP